MKLVLISSEEADQRSLMHYRTKGSKNGQRRYQNEDGSLTPLGYIHYGIDPGNGSANPQQMPRPMFRRNAAPGSSNSGGSANKNANAKQVNKSGGNQATSSRIPAPSSRPINGSQANARSSNQANSSRLPAPNSRQTSGSRNVPVATGAPVNMSRIPAPSSRPTNGSGKPTQSGNQVNSAQNSNPANVSRIPAPSSRPVNGSKVPAPQKNTSANNQAEKLKAQYGKADFKAMGGVNRNGQITDASGKPIVNKKDGNGKYYGKGNIDLNSRKVVKNEDGSISTERSFSVNIDGKETLLPTVIDGKVVDEDTAIDHYYETGEHLGQFDTVEEAESYAQQLHNRQDWYYNRKDVKHTDADENDEDYLMHYRTKGSKNGERRYQREDGSLTPLGYMHYAAMYGWGKRMGKTPADRAEAKAKQAELKAEQAKIKAEKAAAKEQKLNRSEKEIEKDLNDKIQKINEKAKAAEERAKNVTGINEKGKEEEVKRLSLGDQTKLAIVDKSQLEEQKEQIKKARDMSDNELQQAINRLQKEKLYSELLNERANREKGPLHQMASKLFQDAAQDLARKALGVAVDKIIDKAKEKAAFNLSDFKDVDPYSLPSDKLKAVANAFNDAANLARNRNVVNNGGLDPNQGGGNKNGGNNNQNNTQLKKESVSTSDNPPANNENQGVSKNQRKKMRAMANSGQSAAEIAKQLGVSESTVRQYAGEQLKKESRQEQQQTQMPSRSFDAPAPRNNLNNSASKKEDDKYKKERKQLRLKDLKTPEHKSNESMSDYWDKLLRANGAKTKAPTTPKGTVSYLPLSDVKTPARRENESMADYWERLVDENGKRIKTTAQR